MKSDNKKLKTVELVRSTYQPTKAETQETFKLRKRDGSAPTLEDIGKALLQSPGRIRRIDRPRNRR